MSSTSEPVAAPARAAAPASRVARDAKVIGLISVAHFVSHVHLMLLPPIFEPVREALGVSYVEIGAVLTTYNVISAALQTPAGFLVDRIGARAMLVGGLLLATVACAAAALLPGYALFLAAYALLGLANTVYHPSDYAILATVDSRRIGKAFSIHNFAGYFGSGIAPAMVLGAAALWGWQGAYLVAAGLAFLAALLLIVGGSILRASRQPSASTGKGASVGLSLLLSGPVLRNLLFFVCIAMANGGIQTFSVVSLGAIHGTPAATANIGLSGFLLFSALGVLLGGIIADRTIHHERVAAAGFACTAAMAVVLGWVALPTAALVVLMSVGGLLNGIIQPSRDMMVRAVTPAGSFGKVFGFVSTGFNLGGVVSPLLYAVLMDHHEPRAIFMIVTGFIFLALLTAVSRSKPQASAAWTH